MSIVRTHMSTTLDGYTCGPNQRLEAPFGDGTEHMNDWMFQLAAVRTLFGKDVSEQPGLERALDFTLQFMIGAAMTSVLHADPRLRDLIDDFKTLFPTVLTNATTKRRKVSK